MIVAVLSRHAGVALGQADVFVNVAGGVRIDEPGADLGIALAIASATPWAPELARLAIRAVVARTTRLRAPLLRLPTYPREVWRHLELRSLPIKWQSADGRTLWATINCHDNKAPGSCGRYHDRFNLMRVTLR